MRRWSSRIATIAGIDVLVHVTFPLVLAWASVSGAILAGDVSGALGAVGFRDGSRERPVLAIPRTVGVVVAPEARLVDVLPRLVSSSDPFAAVAARPGRIVGLLTPDRILTATRLPPMPDDDEPPPRVPLLRRTG